VKLHHDRMAASAKALGAALAEGAFERAVEMGLDRLPGGATARMRIDLLRDPSPGIRATSRLLPAPPREVALVLSEERVESGDPLLRYKVSRREVYDAARRKAEAGGFWDGLLQNEKGEITETGRANLIALVDGDLLTPPAASGLLPGTVRGVLLDSGAVKERALFPKDLAGSPALFVTNSLIHAVCVSAVEGLDYSPRESALRTTRERLEGILGARLSAGRLIRFPPPSGT